jgi:hypothetical protein
VTGSHAPDACPTKKRVARPPRAPLILAFAFLVCACNRQPEPEGPWTSPIAFDTAVAWVHSGTDSTRLLLELAE